MLLVVKSGPRSACRVPFPILGSDRCQDGKGSSNAVLQAPLELDKAVIFVEVGVSEFVYFYAGGERWRRL